MKKLISLIILTALVGCAEYSSFEQCKLKERQKMEGEVSASDRSVITKYCRSLIPQKCKSKYEQYMAGEITEEEYLAPEDRPKGCEGW